MNGISIGDALLVAAKSVAYAATLGAAGSVFLLLYCGDLVEAGIARRIRRVTRFLCVAAAAASCLKVPIMAAAMSGSPSGALDGGLARMILQAGEGRSLLPRLVGLTLMIPLLPTRAASRAALLGALIAATSFAWSGHVHALPAAWAPTAVLVLHLSAAAFWLGALAPLYMICSDGDTPRVAAAMTRFGRYALLVVTLLLAAGTVLASLLLRSVDDLAGTGYGRLLLLKIALVACLLSLAALNRERLVPGLLRDADRAALRRSIGWEIVLGCLIVLVTAALTTLTGPDAHP